jgi:hypothetical protein
MAKLTHVSVALVGVVAGTAALAAVMSTGCSSSTSSESADSGTDGTTSIFDASRTQFDGSQTQFDGSQTQFDGSQTQFDGSQSLVDAPPGSDVVTPPADGGTSDSSIDAADASDAAAAADADGGDAGGSVSPWNNIAIGAGGFISGIVFSPVQKNLAYARADVGGFYRWNGATSTWTPLTDSFSLSQNNYFGGESIVPDPVDANVVYAAAGEYMSGGNGVILSSTDQGTTWTLNTIGVPMGGNQGDRNRAR